MIRANPRDRGCYFKCGGDGHKPYFATTNRERILARCTNCGGNFHGPGFWLPKVSGAALLEVDPHADCKHGHGPHLAVDGLRQGALDL